MALKNKGVNDETLKQIKLDLTRELIKRKVSKPKYNKLMAFLTHYVNFENHETMSIFTKEVEQLTGNTEPMGVLEILAERRAKDLAKDMANDIVKQRLEKATEQVTEEVTERVTEEVTERVTERVTEQKNHAIVENLLSVNRFTVAEVANFASVPEAFVEKVQNGIRS